MIKTKTLPSVRISAFTEEQIKLAINKLNNSSIFPITLQDYRRYAYLYFAQNIISGKDIKNFKLER